ncbi:cation:proton antiporter family protein [Skermania piniformis]|nr:cation:proton antiporter family protein [Skermania piniformis]
MLIVVAFAGGVLAMLIRLPPMVGFLAAGFVLHMLGYRLSASVETVADLGVTLLLFTIGLKLNVRTLLRGEVWGSAVLHAVTSTLALTLGLFAIKLTGLVLLRDADLRTLLLLGFALSFSSTVFAIKVLESRGEARALYGRIAIGVLVMQDIFAVLFLTGTGHLPSRWAPLLLLLLPGSWLLRAVLDRIGHGEMQVLFGILSALVLGYAAFEAVGIKGDLGALIVGMLLAPNSRAPSLAKSLFDMKELFLVGFFLSIGLRDLPTWETVAVASALLLLLPVATLVYLGVFALFRLRGRTNLLATLALANFSEFGLIVAALASERGWLSDEWLVVLSLAVAASFAIAAPLNTWSEALNSRFERFVPTVPVDRLHPDDRPIDVGDAEAIVLGMGRVGHGAYLRLTETFQMRVLGIENDGDRVRRLLAEGLNVVEGDAADTDFWLKLEVSTGVRLILLAMPAHEGNVFALEQLRHHPFAGRVAAVVKYADQIPQLERLGAHSVHHLYEEAGQELADDAVAGLREPNA